MKVELFHSPGCRRCAAAREGLKTAAETAVTELEWREINVLDEIDRAVERGVLSLPAIVIDGELVFSSLPTPQQLRAALTRRNAKEK
jgi:predicted thioredoxin/glutaredoxin